MPKMKTHKGAAARVKITKGGIVMRVKRVLGAAVKARTSTKRSNRKPAPVKPQDVRALKRLIPGL